MDYKRADWQLFKKIIANNVWFRFTIPNATPDIENALSEFSELVLYAQRRSVREYRRRHFRRRIFPTDLLIINDVFGTTDQYKANEFACSALNFYERAQSNNTHSSDSRVREAVHAERMRYANVLLNVEHQTDYYEVKKTIKYLKPFKTPGTDGIRNILLKNLPNSAIQFLTDIFNKCFAFGHYPTLFKEDKVVPLLKKGKSEENLNNYRLIHMFNAIGKVFDKIFSKRLRKYAADRNIIAEQSSPVYLVKSVIDFIEMNKMQKKSVIFVHLDAERAFDTVCHDRLLFELIRSNFPPYLKKLVQSFLENRFFRIYVNNAQSFKVKMTAGLPQGSSLSALLYSIYTRDIPMCDGIQMIKSTDDYGIFAAANNPNETVQQLNAAMIKLQSYFNRYNIQMNFDKMQAIMFPWRPNGERPSIQLKYGNVEISLKSSIKYVGIILDEMLTFDDHINALQNTAYEPECFNMKRQYDDHQRHMYYVQNIRPKITKASPLWSHKSDIKQDFDDIQEHFLDNIKDAWHYKRIEKLSHYLDRKHDEFAARYSQQRSVVANCLFIRLIMP